VKWKDTHQIKLDWKGKLVECLIGSGYAPNTGEELGEASAGEEAEAELLGLDLHEPRRQPPLAWTAASTPSTTSQS
jgi:hypothetical protein